MDFTKLSTSLWLIGLLLIVTALLWGVFSIEPSSGAPSSTGELSTFFSITFGVGFAMLFIAQVLSGKVKVVPTILRPLGFVVIGIGVLIIVLGLGDKAQCLYSTNTNCEFYLATVGSSYSPFLLWIGCIMAIAGQVLEMSLTKKV